MFGELARADAKEGVVLDELKTGGPRVQAVGALLLLGLLAAPAGAARLLTDRPWVGVGLAAAIAVGSTWLGLLLAYEIDSLPAGTAIIGVATAVFLLAALRDRLRNGTALPGAGARIEA